MTNLKEKYSWFLRGTCRLEFKAVDSVQGQLSYSGQKDGKAEKESER